MLKFGTIIAAIIIFFIAFLMDILYTPPSTSAHNAKAQLPPENADGDLNLANMEIRTIKKAFRIFPKDPVKEIAKKLCISERTLNRKIKQYNLGGPRQLRYPDVK